MLLLMMVLALTVQARAENVLDVRSLGAECDASTDQTAVLQQAIDSLSDGDTLVIPCRLNIGKPGILIRNRSDIRILGVNGGGFKALSPGTLASQGFSPVLFQVRKCTRCIVQSLDIDMNGMASAAIGMDRCTEAAVRYNRVYRVAYPASAAIVATGNRDTEYIGNLISRTSHNSTDGVRGMWIGNGDDQEEEWHPRISANTVEDVGASGIVVYARGAVMIGNSVLRAKGAGIKLVIRRLPGEAPFPQSRIEDNVLCENLFHGIQIEQGDGGVLLKGNLLQQNSISGLYAFGPSFSGRIIGNTFSGNREAGVFLYMASGVEVGSNRFQPSTTATQGHGIVLEALSGKTIRDVAISSNTIWNQAVDGITIRARGGELAGIAIESNAIGGKSRAGVLFDDTAGIGPGRISLSANCFDRQLDRTVIDKSGGIAAPPAANCGTAFEAYTETEEDHL